MSVVVKAAAKKQAPAKSREGKGTTTIVVQSAKRATQPRGPSKKNMVKKSIQKLKNAARVSRLLCPSYNAIDAFNFPVNFRLTKAVASGTTNIGVFAPYNDVLGYIYSQNVSPPDAVTPVSSNTYTDPFITDILTPQTTSGAANATMARWTEFCIEVMVTDALGTINNTIQFVRWQQAGCPVVGTGAAPEFATVWTAIGEHPRLHEQPSAYFAGSKCFHTGMQDRTALEFTPITNGIATYNAVYGTTSGTATIGTGMPWSPIVFAITSPAGSSCTLRIVVKGNIQVSVAPNKFLSRLQKPLSHGDPGAESRWWAKQTALKTMPLVMPGGRPTGKGRGVSGYVGMSAGQ